MPHERPEVLRRPRTYARDMPSNRKPLDDLRETVGRLGGQLPRPGLRGVDDLMDDLFGGRKSCWGRFLRVFAGRGSRT